jgi:hypothetical protein
MCQVRWQAMMACVVRWPRVHQDADGAQAVIGGAHCCAPAGPVLQTRKPSTSACQVFKPFRADPVCRDPLVCVHAFFVPTMHSHAPRSTAVITANASHLMPTRTPVLALPQPSRHPPPPSPQAAPKKQKLALVSTACVPHRTALLHARLHARTSCLLTVPQHVGHACRHLP